MNAGTPSANSAPDPQVVRPRPEERPAFRGENPHGGADKINREAEACPEQIDDGQREQHPDENEPGEVALDLVGLADERDRGADGRDVQDRGGFAPGCGFIAAQQDEDGERLAQDQRCERNRATNRPAEEIPVVGDEQDDPGAD
jgi:hypothetical protein